MIDIPQQIASEIARVGYCILPNALPAELCTTLTQAARAETDRKYRQAGIGRADQHQQDRSIRSDEIDWIDDGSEPGKAWLAWCSELQAALNQCLFLGLFSFECHFAHYAPGRFYGRHLDAFKGRTNRVLSLVTYLNSGWQSSDGGELVLYQDEADQRGVAVLPEAGTVVVFLSDEFPHEVLPAKVDRYSIAGWFRVNTSSGRSIDPPS
ncbi:2OG-Fe(II) oxygenase [Umboniibacter marinipuniceus]|uniref:SM-20-related protein n=1 Tax=Umboniibacter marinipuniceus TaxID=569599 RepID=A0A3M0ABP1_9GAMM|nr:2OG-Fe(II) oxygenase [Umboniibacter marinipuniceus]RMA82583.1 SM-20-related protein [Umboniibacter marinipuniceus]